MVGGPSPGESFLSSPPRFCHVPIRECPFPECFDTHLFSFFFFFSLPVSLGFPNRPPQVRPQLGLPLESFHTRENPTRTDKHFFPPTLYICVSGSPSTYLLSASFSEPSLLLLSGDPFPSSPWQLPSLKPPWHRVFSLESGGRDLYYRFFI